jgi:two-component system chemotaxis response regulator CheB
VAGLPLLVLGASAGGVEALMDLVGGLPADLPAAVLVTVHTGQRPASRLANVLARAGPLPAEHPHDAAPLRAGRILVAPPDRHLLVVDGAVALSAAPQINRHRPAVDAMFASAARARGPRVVAGVLSGALDDGAVGAALVDRAGGRVAVQDPTEAMFDSMPRSALAAVPHACVAPAKELGPLLTRMLQELSEGGDQKVQDVPHGQDDLQMEDSADPGFLRPDEGQTTRMVCPECNGALARIDLPRISYFRCHVGHQYGPQSLEAAQREATESKLWMAVAALEEHAAMARYLEHGGDGNRADYASAAEHSAELARLVRERLTRDRHR